MSDNILQRSVTTTVARNLASTTKTAPQMMSITPRLLVDLLPWVHVASGTYRVNRTRIELSKADRIPVDVVDGSCSFAPESLRSVPLFSGLPAAIITRMANRFRPEAVSLGNKLISEGEDGNQFFIIAQGQVEVLSKGIHGANLRLALLTEGEFFGESDLVSDKPSDVTVRTITPCTLLTLSRRDLDAVRCQRTHPSVQNSNARSANIWNCGPPLTATANATSTWSRGSQRTSRSRKPSWITHPPPASIRCRPCRRSSAFTPAFLTSTTDR
jgi:hypothetical protein